MKIHPQAVAVPALVVALVAGACANDTRRAESEGAPGAATSGSTGDAVSPITARMAVSDLKVGTQLGADGAVAENTDSFDSGQAIFASVAVEDVDPGKSVEVVWKGPDDQNLHSESLAVPASETHMVFRAPDTSTWQPGDYTVEIRLDEHLAASEGFDIEAPEGAGAS